MLRVRPIAAAGRCLMWAAFVLGATAGAREARADVAVDAPADPLVAARALFAEALDDERAGRFSAALAKFERVREVRDTAPVEFRIGSCYEGLGEAAAAYGAYSAAAKLGRDDPKGAEVASAASNRLAALTPRVARLTLLMPGPAPLGLDLRVDGSPVVTSPGEPIPLEPGRHVVTAAAENMAPFRSELSLAQGAEVSLTVPLEAPSASAPPAPVPAPEAAIHPPHEAGSSRTVGWVLLGAGAASIAASAVLLVVRHDEIASLDRRCPGGACPAGSDVESLTSTRNRALVLGPVAAACGALGVAAAGIGVYLVARGSRAPSSTPAALVVRLLVASGGMGIGMEGALP